MGWIDDLRESIGRPKVEPIPDECLPFNGDAGKLADFLAGPKLDAEGRIVGGMFHGWTEAEVIADRDAYNRATGGDGRMW